MPAPDVPRTGFLFCHGRSNKQEYTIYNEAWSGGDLLAGHGSLGLDRYVFRNADPGTQQYRRTTNKALQAQEQTIGSMGDRRRTGWSGHGCMPDRMQCNDTHPWLQQRLGPGCPPSHVPPRLLLRSSEHPWCGPVTWTVNPCPTHPSDAAFITTACPMQVSCTTEKQELEVLVQAQPASPYHPDCLTAIPTLPSLPLHVLCKAWLKITHANERYRRQQGVR